MRADLLYAALAGVFMLPLIALNRRALTLVFVISVTVFVIALPWARWIFAGYEDPRIDEVLIDTYLAILLFTLGVTVVALHIRETGAMNVAWIYRAKSQEGAARLIWSSLAILTAVWAVRIFRASQYGILFSGSASEEAIANQSYFFVVLNSMMEMAALGAVFYLALYAKDRRLVIWPFLTAELVWALATAGRRGFIFMAALMLFIRIASTKRLQVRFAILALLISYGLLQFITPVFLASRTNVLGYLVSEDMFFSIYTGVGDAIRDLLSGTVSTGQVIAENFEARGDAGMFLSSITSAMADGYPKLWGEGLLTSAAWAVPSFVTSKPALMAEQFIQESFGLASIDDAISWIAVGYADGGFIGCFLYGALFAYLATTLIWIGKWAKSEYLVVIGSVVAAQIFFNVEADPLFLFASVRDMLILAIGVFSFRVIGRSHARFGHS